MSLAYNGFTSGLVLSYLTHYLPDIENLSLEGNSLRTWGELDRIGGKVRKLGHLRELILVGNPLRELEYKNGRSDRYKK